MGILPSTNEAMFRRTRKVATEPSSIPIDMDPMLSRIGRYVEREMAVDAITIPVMEATSSRRIWTVVGSAPLKTIKDTMYTCIIREGFKIYTIFSNTNTSCLSIIINRPESITQSNTFKNQTTAKNIPSHHCMFNECWSDYTTNPMVYRHSTTQKEYTDTGNKCPSISLHRKTIRMFWIRHSQRTMNSKH